MKRRILCLMASLLLCGAVSAQNHWGDNPDSHAQPSNTPIVATVQINGVTVETPSSGYRLGAFIDGNLWGIAAPHDDKFWIQVFYETAGEEISFKLYDGQNEYTTCTVVDPTTMTAVTTSEAGAVVTLNFTNEQTVELAAGWNWWSTNLEITLDDLKEALIDADGHSGMKIVAEDTKSITYNGNIWRGNLSSLDVTRFYKLYTTIDCEVTLTGNPINPVDHPVSIVKKGYNWIAIPLNEEMTISDVFNGFAVSGDKITAADTKSTTFNGTIWRGNFSTLKPGQGYIYYSNSLDDRTFTFPSGNQ